MIDSLTAPDPGVPLTPEEEIRRKKMIDNLTTPEPKIPLTLKEVEKEEEVERKEEIIGVLVVTGN